MRPHTSASSMSTTSKMIWIIIDVPLLIAVNNSHLTTPVVDALTLSVVATVVVFSASLDDVVATVLSLHTTYRVAQKTGPPSHCKYSEIP